MHMQRSKDTNHLNSQPTTHCSVCFTQLLHAGTIFEHNTTMFIQSNTYVKCRTRQCVSSRRHHDKASSEHSCRGTTLHHGTMPRHTTPRRSMTHGASSQAEAGLHQLPCIIQPPLLWIFQRVVRLEQLREALRGLCTAALVLAHLPVWVQLHGQLAVCCLDLIIIKLQAGGKSRRAARRVHMALVPCTVQHK